MGQPGEMTVLEQPSSDDMRSEKQDKPETTFLKATKDGIPLHPQPSDDPEDPLVRQCRAIFTLNSHGVRDPAS